MTNEHADQGINQIMGQEPPAPSAETKPVVSPLAAAGVGLAGAVAGASMVVLLNPFGSEPPPPEPVKSCAEQYHTIAYTLGEMVEEGISAGQSPDKGLAWIGSIHARQSDIEEQLETLRNECVGGSDEG